MSERIRRDNESLDEYVQRRHKERSASPDPAPRHRRLTDSDSAANRDLGMSLLQAAYDNRLAKANARIRAYEERTITNFLTTVLMQGGRTWCGIRRGKGNRAFHADNLLKIAVIMAVSQFLGKVVTTKLHKDI